MSIIHLSIHELDFFNSSPKISAVYLDCLTKNPRFFHSKDVWMDFRKYGLMDVHFEL